MPYLCSVKHSPPNKASLNTRVDQPGPWILWTYLVCSHFGWVFDFVPFRVCEGTPLLFHDSMLMSHVFLGNVICVP